MLRLGFVLLLLIALSKPINAATQSLYDSETWRLQRSCAKDCFWWNNGDWLGGRLSCGIPIQNACYCRADLQPSARSIISTCVSTWCGGSPTVDIASATSMYLSYCMQVGATVVAPPITTTSQVFPSAPTLFVPEPPSSNTQSAMTVTVTVFVPVPTPFQTSDAARLQSLGFGAPDVKGIGYVAVVVLVVLVANIIFVAESIF